MNRMKLGEILSVKHGWAFKGEYFAEDGEQSILTPGNFFEKGGFKPNNGKERYYIGTYPKEYLCHKGDLIVAMTQQAEGLLGSSALVPENNKYLHNQRIGLITCDEKRLNKLFAYYLFMTKSVREQLERSSSGTKVKHTSPEKIYDVEVEIPDVISQQKIANLLWSIDEKIANNNAINDNLQQQAILLYDYWFTQFDFPDANGKPYYSSGNKMTWNNHLKKNIPLSWKVKPLKAICEICLGGTPSTTVSKYWNGSISWLNSGEIVQFPVVTSEKKITQLGLENSTTKLMSKNTTVVSITGNIRASILALDACANQSVVGILENEIFKSPFIYQNMLRLLKHYTSISTGNCQKHISKGAIEESLVCIPDSIVLKQYYVLSEPIYKQMHEIVLENKHLTELRNWLLPMLMNGQVTIKD